MNCVFCGRIANGEFDYETEFSVSFLPLNPVTPGHRLFVPKRHVKDALTDPLTTGRVMEDACSYYHKTPMNIITSVGEEATQSIFHLHIHVVPRIRYDGLKLPWTP